MALRNRTSKIAFVGVGLMGLFVAAAVILRTGSDPGQPESGNPSPAPAANSAVADIPVETLTAVSGGLESLKLRMEDFKERMEADLGDFRSGMESDRSAREEAEAQRTEALLLELAARDAEIEQIKASMESRTGGLMNEMQSLIARLENRLEGDYPVQGAASRGELGPDGRIWFSGAGSSAGDPAGLTGQLDRLTGLPADPLGIRTQAETVPAPAWSIPREAVLVRARSLTALIGRVPVGGQVSEPLPFRIIAGADNLLANRQELPEISETIWSGVAIGDAALECVTGRLTSVTFIFADGTISSYPQDPSGDAVIGWLSDERGYPCIPGRHVSNTREVLTKMFGAGFASGAADAFAQAQTTTIGTAAGGLSTAITGSAGEYALGRGAASGFGEWAKIVAERARDVFDAVIVPPGQVVTIHTSVLIPIDYDHEGRALRHLARADSGSIRPGGLD